MKFTQLPFANLLGKKGRSAALFLFALLLSLSIFGGSLLLLSLRKGLRSLEYRLGADIIVTPSGAFVKKGLESILLYGNRTTFYMPRSRLEETLSVDGVEKASAQVFLATLSSGCCSVGLQIIGFDPASDFTVQPWLTKDFGGVLEKGDVIIGSKILSSVGETLKFFDVPCKVVAQLGETGTGLDNAVYTSIDTIQDLIDASIRKGVNEKMLKGAGRYISSIMVKAEEGQDLDDLCRRIEHDVKQVKAVRTK
ncbi:MAG: ABC transporter permease, partial [Treponema sp.]|nr:ABC transporter permease [Treponema sp.]